MEEKILGLQKFKLKTANTVISRDNASLSTMDTGQLFDLFSLDDKSDRGGKIKKSGDSTEGVESKGIKAILENLPELWDESQYSDEYSLENYSKK